MGRAGERYWMEITDRADLGADLHAPLVDENGKKNASYSLIREAEDGDIAIQGKYIAAIAPPGRIADDSVPETIDAAGHVVCPGFIDIQSHSIASLMIDGRSLSKITQGVTTEIMGEGWTPAPYGGKITNPIMTEFL